MSDEQKRPTLKSVTERLDAIDAVVSKMRPADTEARAISLCARALGDLPKVRSNNSYGTSYSSGATEYTDTAAIARILDYLRQRYGLPDPNAEVRRLAERCEQLEFRNVNLEGRLNTVLGAVQVQS